MAHASRPLAVENSGESRARAEDSTEQAGVAALHQSEARYRSLFAAMEQGFCLIEKVATLPDEPSDYRYLAVNQAFVRHCGLLDVLGKTVRQVVPEAENHILAAYDDALASGQVRQFEEYVATLDIWIAAEILPDTQPGCLAVLFSNVSARHQAATLQESVARQSYLLALSDALRPELDAAAVQATVTQAALHYFRTDRCYYGEIAGDILTIRQDAAQPGLPSLAAAYSLSATPFLRTLLQPRQPIVVADVTTSPLLADDFRQLCQANHLLAYITVPIVRQNELVGVLCLAQRTLRQWTSLELTLVQETAERTWAAVEQARAEEALRRSEMQFRSLVEATSDTVYKMSADGQQINQIFDRDFLVDRPSARNTWLE
ncbi:MAG: GAF domain-containing protein, partial [Hymenobacter sp.]